MFVKGCPRCRSVSNVKPALSAGYAEKGGKRCDWCGFTFHVSELVDVWVPGQAEPKKKEQIDPEPYWFDSEIN
jgi:hypothetical protein